MPLVTDLTLEGALEMDIQLENVHVCRWVESRTANNSIVVLYAIQEEVVNIIGTDKLCLIVCRDLLPRARP